MESFFHTLKTELVHNRHYAHGRTPEVISSPTSKGHSAIGYISPIEMELKAA